MDLMFFINALLKRKWVIIICTLFGLIASLLFTLTKKNMYLSAATYSTGFTMKQQVRLSGDEGLNIFEIDQRFKNVIETFKSPVVISMLSYDLMLHDLTEPMPFTTLTAKQKSKPEYKNANFAKAKQMLLEKRATREILKAYDPEEDKVYELIMLYGYDNESLLSELTVDRVSGTDYLNIIYRSTNPEMSAFVVNTIGKEFISFFASINNTRTEESAGKLDSLAARKKKEIEEKTTKLSDYKKSFKSANIEDRGKAALSMAQDQLAQLSTEQAKLNTLKASLLSLTQKLEALGPVTDAQTVNNTELIQLQQKNRDLAVDLVRKGGTDPSIEAQIASNQKRINQLQVNTGSGTTTVDKRKQRDDLQSQIISVRNDIEAENLTIAALQSGVTKYNTDAGHDAGADVLVKSMENEIDLLNKQYEQMVGQLQNAENINVAPEINFKQTLKGQPAIRPEHTGRKVSIAVSTFAALLMSSLIIVVMDFLDQSVRAPSIFNRVVKLKPLSVIMRVDLEKKSVQDYFDTSSEDGISGEDNAYFVESIRKLRYEIEQSGKRVILFTSTKPQEGKTTIIEALAYSFSLSRKKVLLIDTNFSNNQLTEQTEAAPVLNTMRVHGEPASIVNAVAAAKKSAGIPNVEIIGCEKSQYSPDELLQDDNLLKNLPALLGKYDFILMEGAALNTHAGTKELLKYSDAIVAIFSAKSVIRQTDKESIRFLQQQREKMLGGVLNRVERDNIDM